MQTADNSSSHELLRIPDTVGVALAWRQYGFHHLHVVDLDALAGQGHNGPEIDAILGSTDAEVQIAGGFKSAGSIDRLLSEGARRIVVDARILEEPDWIAEISTTFPGQVIAEMKVRDRRVLSNGWTRYNSQLATDVADELAGLPLAAVLVTSVNREPDLHAQDLALLEDIAETIELPLFAAGGLRSVNDLRLLAECGVAAAILGVEVYTGAMNPRAVAEEFAE